MPYRTAFGILRPPFSAEIEAHALFPFESFTQCLARLDYHRRERGLAVLTGRIGAGKTTAARAHVKRLAPSSYLPLYAAVPSGCPNPLKAVVESLMTDLGEKIHPLNPSRTLQTLYQALRASHDKGRTPILQIDEAHNLDDKGLLGFKGFLNHDMDSHLPMAILLSGAPELSRTLAQRNLEEIRQRLLFVYTLKGLKREEMGPYIAARLKAAGCERSLFPPDIVDEMYRHTHGLPRRVNQVANLCLVAAATANKTQVDSVCLLQALAEMGSTADDAQQERVSL